MTDSSAGAASHEIRLEPTSAHIRIESGDEVLVDTREALLLHETRCPPRYYVPPGDVRMDLLEATTTSTHCPYKGDASYWSLRTGQSEVEDIAWAYLDPTGHREIKGYLCFYPGKVDRFLIDGEPIA